MTSLQNSNTKTAQIKLNDKFTKLQYKTDNIKLKDKFTKLKHKSWWNHIEWQFTLWASIIIWCGSCLARWTVITFRTLSIWIYITISFTVISLSTGYTVFKGCEKIKIQLLKDVSVINSFITDQLYPPKETLNTKYRSLWPHHFCVDNISSRFIWFVTIILILYFPSVAGQKP